MSFLPFAAEYSLCSAGIVMPGALPVGKQHLSAL